METETEDEAFIKNYRTKESGTVFILLSAQSAVTSTTLSYELGTFVPPHMLRLSSIILFHINKRPLPRFCV